jgi:kynurenine formamidase
MCVPGTVEAVRGRTARGEVPVVSRRAMLLTGAGGALAAALPRPVLAAPKNNKKNRSRDLTHLFRAGFPVYTFDPPARRTLVTIPSGGFYSQEWTFGEHSGTHMDAPGHFVAGGRLTPEIDPRELMVPIIVIDISRRAATDPDAAVTVDDLVRFERRHGRIPRRALVCEYSGWESRVNDPDAFKNADANGTYHFPGFGIEAVNWLLANRSITGIGVDTLSLDVGASTTFDVHVTLLGADKYGVENLANLSRIPPRGAEVFVGVIPWEEGSGGPCRVVARW